MKSQGVPYRIAYNEVEIRCYMETSLLIETVELKWNSPNVFFVFHINATYSKNLTHSFRCNSKLTWSGKFSRNS